MVCKKRIANVPGADTLAVVRNLPGILSERHAAPKHPRSDCLDRLVPDILHLLHEHHCQSTDGQGLLPAMLQRREHTSSPVDSRYQFLYRVVAASLGARHPDWHFDGFDLWRRHHGAGELLLHAHGPGHRHRGCGI